MPRDIPRQPVGRRHLLKSAAVLAGSATAGSWFPPTTTRGAALAAGQTAAVRGRRIVVSNSKAIVETTAGRIRGYIENDIFTFKGVPYGASTATAARFVAPSRPEPWDGIRSSLMYGPVCPQPRWTNWGNDEQAFLFEWDEGEAGEDCLRLNLWTPSINHTTRRPVMVWLHGGDFMAGSGQEFKAYDGGNLARRGDVVVVTVNHRLNVLGHLNLAGYGAKYASSGNAGMLDLVLALEWVRDNISRFGGDPGNVTIFGYSGGGSKVSVLMAMPSAKGLFHRAVIQSADLNQGMRHITVAQSAQIADAVVAALGLRRSILDQIQTMPYARLWTTANEVARKLGGRWPHGGWGPVVDGSILPEHPFELAAPAVSAKVPLMIGTVLNERAGRRSLTPQELDKLLADRFGEAGGTVLAALRKLSPSAKPYELIGLSRTNRTVPFTQATRKAAQKSAPAFMYMFTWKTPVLDGLPLAFHGSELPFIFHNVDRCAHITGGTDEAHALADRVSDAWINFARSGNPNHSGLPKWSPVVAGPSPVMTFDNICEVRLDPDRELRLLLEAHPERRG